LPIKKNDIGRLLFHFWHGRYKEYHFCAAAEEECHNEFENTA
jgi:hypothetical protein